MLENTINIFYGSGGCRANKGWMSNKRIVSRDNDQVVFLLGKNKTVTRTQKPLMDADELDGDFLNNNNKKEKTKKTLGETEDLLTFKLSKICKTRK